MGVDDEGWGSEAHLGPGVTCTGYQAAHRPKTGSGSGSVCVTGASGFIASHVVEQLLAKGYTVHGCVRALDDPAKTEHLRRLNHADARLKLFATGDMQHCAEGTYDAALDGCCCVMHTATPIAMGAPDGETQIFIPAMRATAEIVRAAAKSPDCRTFVLTSSMSAMAPQPEPPLKSEAHWSDPEAQREKGNWYGHTKTMQERFCEKFAQEHPDAFRYVAICPTGVFGPMHQPGVNATMGWIASLCKGAKDQAANDSMSFIDVRDCAAHHVAGFENEKASGRYMSLVESLHWNDIFALMKDLYPAMPDVKPCDGEPVKPTQFDTTRMQSLGVQVRDVRTILRDAIADLDAKGALAK